MKSFPMRALPSAADNDVPQAEVLLAPRGPAHSIHTPTIWRYGATQRCIPSSSRVPYPLHLPQAPKPRGRRIPESLPPHRPVPDGQVAARTHRCTPELEDRKEAAPAHLSSLIITFFFFFIFKLLFKCFSTALMVYTLEKLWVKKWRRVSKSERFTNCG